MRILVEVVLFFAAIFLIAVVLIHKYLTRDSRRERYFHLQGGCCHYCHRRARLTLLSSMMHKLQFIQCEDCQYIFKLDHGLKEATVSSKSEFNYQVTKHYGRLR